jgi:SAM-dependent methyltransferase
MKNDMKEKICPICEQPIRSDALAKNYCKLCGMNIDNKSHEHTFISINGEPQHFCARARIRESDMPEEPEWSAFFDPDHVLTTLGVNNTVHDVADFGCGYGTFTIPAARIISGSVYAIDIDREKIKVLQQKIKENEIINVVIIERDVFDSGLIRETVDYVFIFNILHTERPLSLLKEAFRVLTKKGSVAIINWNLDPETPRGPPMEMRPSMDQCVEWCANTGFRLTSKRVYDLNPYHYGLTMRK